MNRVNFMKKIRADSDIFSVQGSGIDPLVVRKKDKNIKDKDYNHVFESYDKAQFESKFHFTYIINYYFNRRVSHTRRKKIIGIASRRDPKEKIIIFKRIGQLR